MLKFFMIDCETLEFDISTFSPLQALSVTPQKPIASTCPLSEPTTTGSPAPASDPSLKDILATVKTLSETFTKKSGEWDNLRSLHDRQMTEIRQAMAGKGGGAARLLDDVRAGGQAVGRPGGR